MARRPPALSIICLCIPWPFFLPLSQFHTARRPAALSPGPQSFYSPHTHRHPDTLFSGSPTLCSRSFRFPASPAAARWQEPFARACCRRSVKVRIYGSGSVFLRLLTDPSSPSIWVMLLDLALSMDVNQAMRLSSQVIIWFLDTKQD
jgi:hypothetical protein